MDLTTSISSSITSIPTGTNYVKVSFWIHTKPSVLSSGQTSYPWGGCWVTAAFRTNDGGWPGVEDITEIQDTPGVQDGFVLVERTIAVPAGGERIHLYIRKRGPGYMFIDDVCIQPLASMPVDFGSINASVKNNIINISWSTLTENNNDHFEILVSKDGKSFTAIDKVYSKAENGNASQKTHYSYTRDLNSVAGFLTIPALFAFVIMGYKRKTKICLVLLAIFLLAGVHACTKRAAIEASSVNSKLFVQIKQVDKDGTSKLSRIVTALAD